MKEPPLRVYLLQASDDYKTEYKVKAHSLYAAKKQLLNKGITGPFRFLGAIDVTST